MINNDEHILDLEKAKPLETELQYLQSQRYQSLPSKQAEVIKSSQVIFYCPFNYTFAKFEKYNKNEIMELLNSYQKEDFFIIQIDNDNLLYEELLKMKFKSEFENIDKLFDLKLDYCFSPIDELLCFNLSVLTNIEIDEVEKYLIQIFFSENGVYIINKDCCENILSIFMKKFNFREVSKEEFFENTPKEGNNFVINNMSIAEKKKKSFCSFKKKRSNSNRSNKSLKKMSSLKNSSEDKENDYKELVQETDSIIESFNKSKVTNVEKRTSWSPSKQNRQEEEYNNGSPRVPNFNSEKTFSNYFTFSNFPPGDLAKIKEENLDSNFGELSNAQLLEEKSSTKIFNSNFSTDDLIYYLLSFSLVKLEEFASSLVKEAESLKGIYLELSEKERKDFFRRIHNMEIALQVIYQETIIKKKFLKYSKAQFKVYNKLSHNFYFKNTFNFFIELIISKVTQLEIVFEKLENTIRMIKENYSIIIEDNTEKQNIKLNSVMKVLAIITTIYAPLNVIPNLFGMNVQVPWQNTESLWPFFGIFMTAISLVIIELFIFKKLKWLED
jgi:Mg2+ and Co2+ transporter CorA